MVKRAFTPSGQKTYRTCSTAAEAHKKAERWLPLKSFCVKPAYHRCRCVYSAWAGALCLWDGRTSTCWSRDLRRVRRLCHRTTGALSQTAVSL